MVNGFDRILVEVPDVVSAAGDYSKLLGLDPFWPPEQPGGSQLAWFVLDNTVIQLQRCDLEQANICGLVFSGASGSVENTALDNSLGLDLALCDGSATREVRAGSLASTADMSVDHLVLRTNDASGCIELFGEQLGIRLALDKMAPQWGGRMLFFRAGKLTLEVISADEPRADNNVFWGIAYQCRDIDSCATRLARQGVSISEIREGRKPGTRVATVKSHCLDIPTLLVGPAT